MQHGRFINDVVYGYDVKHGLKIERACSAGHFVGRKKQIKTLLSVGTFCATNFCTTCSDGTRHASDIRSYPPSVAMQHGRFINDVVYGHVVK